ncbi:NAD(P)H-binding protein [Kocuria indica]|uniref:NAD(P)H-binding protein n=1 Tax=Kocuria marina subsp. indica TaxID=1049583 RepID=A0A6N9R0W8_9MICC|nr:NAD(P)H-binding protein [Kocuria indica]
MKIAIIGATGTAGRATAHAARQAGDSIIELSRGTGVELHTGARLVEALHGADAVIDTSNPFPASPDADLVDTFRATTTRVVEACQRAGVSRLVHLSICNIDNPVFDEFDYYLAKRAQEQVLAASSLEHVVVRSAQWMEFALNPGAVTQDENEVRVEDWLVQPIAVDEVARVLVESVIGEVRDRQVAGPDQIRLPDLTRALLTSRNDQRPVIATAPSLPALADGVLLAPTGAELLGPDVTTWVQSQRPVA